VFGWLQPILGGHMESGPKQFISPEEEIAYLRNQIASKERELLEHSPEADTAAMEAVGKNEVFEYGTFTPGAVLSQEQQLPEGDMIEQVEKVDISGNPVEELVQLAMEKGIHTALSVMERSSSPFATDEVHRRLVELIKSGVEVQGLKDGVPPWQILHSTLFEVRVPEVSADTSHEHQLPEIFGMMEQFSLACRQLVSTRKINTMYWKWPLRMEVIILSFMLQSLMNLLIYSKSNYCRCILM